MRHETVLTKTVDALLGVYQLNCDITLSLVKVASPISGQVHDHCCCHHGMREVGLNEVKQKAISTEM